MSSRGLREDHAQEHYQRDLEAVIDRLDPPPFVLYASNTRTPAAVQFALDHPDRVFALVLGPCRLSQSVNETQAAFFNTLPEANWELFLRSLVSQYQAPEDIPRSLALLNLAFEQDDFAKRQLVALRGISEESISRLRTPTLFLYPRDYWGGENSSKMMMRAAQLARATFTLIDGSFALGDAEQGIRAIEAFVADLAAHDDTKPLTLPSDDGLSHREVEVLELMAAGRSNQQIADELVISINTVRRHVSNVFDKTGAANRTQAAAYAKDHGIA
jgi:DNA-binding CsgD family transcriptional regulator